MYNKIFTKILDSSIWLETDSTRIVWLTLIAAMDEDGFAQFASVSNLAHRARVSEEAGIAAVNILQSPDRDSGDPDNDGRRIERVPGGWMILNAAKYREIVTRAVSQEKTRQRVARFRAKNNDVTPVTDGNADVTPVKRSVTPSEADTDTETTNTSLARSAEREVYDLYPKKRSPKSALKQIALAIKEHGLERIKERTAAYAAAVATWPQADKQFVPDPERWFKRGQFDDDPATWQRNQSTSNGIGSPVDPSSEQLTRAREAGWQ